MNILMKGACIGLLAMTTMAYAGKGKHKAPKATTQTTQTCGPDCPHPCPPICTGGSCCHK